MKKIGRAVGEVCSWLLLAVMVCCIAALVFTKLSGGEPSFLGYRVFVISTGSMEPAMQVGDVILSRNFHPGDPLESGDVLTYRGSGETEGLLVTHRLVSAEGAPGERILVLRGDANTLADSPMEESRVVAKTLCKLKVFSKIYALMQSKFGLPVLILIIFGFILAESLDFSKALRERREAQARQEENEKKNDAK